jgi:methylphosphotriester-DNA--protein-cysteine methyltransferase
MRRLCETAGLGLVRHTSSVIATTTGAVAIGDLSVAAGVSTTHLAQRFKELIGVTPKRLARTYRFAATVFAITPPDRSTGPGSRRPGTSKVRRRFLREHPGHALDSWPLPAD